MIYRREDRGRETWLFIAGELDALTAPDLRTAISAIIEEGRKSVVVDLSELDIIDSSGIGVLVSLYKRTCAHGGRCVVRGAKNQPLAVFKLLRMDRVFVDPDRGSARIP